MTDPAQESLPGTDVPSTVVPRNRRGRPKGARTLKLGALFADGLGDYRLYVMEEDGTLHPIPDSGGFTDCAETVRWLRHNGGREELMGRQVLALRALHLVRLAMQPTLQFKPRGKLPPRTKNAAPVAEPEPATVSTS